jgi:hypothetical protein
VIHMYVADSTGRLTANANARPNLVGKCAVLDMHVLSRTGDGVSFDIELRLPRDALVGRIKVAAVNGQMLAGVDVDRVAPLLTTTPSNVT